MANFDLSVYLVTDTRLCGELGVAATVREAVASGVTMVQLRDHHLPDDDFVRLGREVATALDGSGVPLLVDDRVHLVEAIGAHGVHVGQDDMDVVEARRLLGPDALIGLSVHTLEQVAAAKARPAGSIDYLGIGPVWQQTTKLDAASPVGLDGLRDMVSHSPWPSVAIGGIGMARAAAVRATGASGVAVVSAICGRPDVGKATRELTAAWRMTPREGEA
jgi:thiamine-phosphate pyrophosphorylase